MPQGSLEKMSIKQVRNENFKPFIDDEGFFDGEGLIEPPQLRCNKDKLWYENLEPHMRLYHHNTLSSARRHANFVNVRFVLVLGGFWRKLSAIDFLGPQRIPLTSFFPVSTITLMIYFEARKKFSNNQK